MNQNQSGSRIVVPFILLFILLCPPVMAQESTAVTILAPVLPMSLCKDAPQHTRNLLETFFDPANDYVRLRTVRGDVEMDLYSNDAPKTVANFLRYVLAGRYANSFVHRSDPGFVIQGGGFTFQDFSDPDPEVADYVAVPSFGAVVNEPGISNTRGTVAMAKVGGLPDSATSQWFVNLADNSENLDFQNGGFTVFARVREPDMAVVDDIAGLPVWNAAGIHSAFGQIPLINFVWPGPLFDETNLVMVYSAQLRTDNALTYTAVSDDPEVCAAAIDSKDLVLTFGQPGQAQVTVKARAWDGRQAWFSFAVRVCDCDLNGDGAANTGDVVTALKTAAGMQGGGPALSPDQDVNQDGKVGLAEAFFLMQNLARER